MDLNIAGKTALVLGGSKGLGLGVATGLAEEGVSVALVARDAATVEAAARDIHARFGVPAFGLSADLADPSATATAVDAANRALGGKIDILINNTGGPPPSGAAGLDPELWRQQFQSLVLSVIGVTDQVLPGMRARGWGRVLTIASTVVVEPNPALALSNALRSTLVGWSKTLASEVAGDGVTVNILLPGQIATDRTAFLDESTAARLGSTADAVKAAKLKAIPAGRYGTPEEFGKVAAFMASEAAAYMTGGMLRIDGGVLRSV